MKGVMFTEFLDWVEDRWSPDVVEYIIADAALESGGAYTSVGTYHHGELLRLVTALSERVSEDVSSLVQAFGVDLFPRLLGAHPKFGEIPGGALGLLGRLDSVIHPEVEKLYPDAEVPSFDVLVQTPGHLRIAYRSSRPLADLAAGLIEGCSVHFGASLNVVRTVGPGNATTFDIRDGPKG